jgi:hypothetical protein
MFSVDGCASRLYALIRLIPYIVNWLERCLFTGGDSYIPGAFCRYPLLAKTTSRPAWQVNYYYTWCSEDPLAHKITVAVLFLLTILKTIQSFSVAAVRFGPVQCLIFLNPRLDLGFGSAKLLNLGLDLRFRSGEVRSRFRGSDGFEAIFISHGPNHEKNVCSASLQQKKPPTHQYTRAYRLPK